MNFILFIVLYGVFSPEISGMDPTYEGEKAFKTFTEIADKGSPYPSKLIHGNFL